MYLFNLICLLMLIGLMYSFVLFLSTLGFRHCLGEILLATWRCDLWVWSVYLVSFFRAFLSPPFWLVFTLLVLFYIWKSNNESCSPPARWGSLDFIRAVCRPPPPPPPPPSRPPQPRAPDLSGHSSSSKESTFWAPQDYVPERQMSDRMPQRMPNIMSEYVSDRKSVCGDHSKKVSLIYVFQQVSHHIHFIYRNHNMSLYLEQHLARPTRRTRRKELSGAAPRWFRAPQGKCATQWMGYVTSKIPRPSKYTPKNAQRL